MDNDRLTSARHVGSALAVDDVVLVPAGIADTEVDEHEAIILVRVVVPIGEFPISHFIFELEQSNIPDEAGSAVLAVPTGECYSSLAVFVVLNAIDVGTDPVRHDESFGWLKGLGCWCGY